MTMCFIHHLPAALLLSHPPTLHLPPFPVLQLLPLPPITPYTTTDHPALLPTCAARGFFFSGLLELARLPALADFTRAAMSAFFGGDASEWERALMMPHYCAAGMPACSLNQVQLYDAVDTER